MNHFSAIIIFDRAYKDLLQAAWQACDKEQHIKFTNVLSALFVNLDTYCTVRYDGMNRA
jgi:hypothetical protein